MGSAHQRVGTDVEVNIPLQQETAARRSARPRRCCRRRARARRRCQQLLGELAENLAGLEAARRTEIADHDQPAAAGRLTLQAALAGYENGKVDFATLLDAQRQIRKAKQDLLKAQAEAQMRLAEIERMLGEEL